MKQLTSSAASTGSFVGTLPVASSVLRSADLVSSVAVKTNLEALSGQVKDVRSIKTSPRPGATSEVVSTDLDSATFSVSSAS